MAQKISRPTVVKYCLGNDISKNEMSVCFSQIDAQQHVSIKGTRTFQNNKSGWNALHTWIKRFYKDTTIPLILIVEATGVYYENFAYHFKDLGFNLHVLLPNKTKYYAKSLNIKTKTDKVDATLLAQIGLEREHSLWKGMSPLMRKIKQLSRQRVALITIRVQVKNQLHAHTYSHCSQKMITQQMQKHIAFLDKQILAIEVQIKKFGQEDNVLHEKIENICMVKGLSVLTVLTIIAETNEFELIQNKSQLVSYAGYDVVENSSGTIKGKTRISKKGNSHIRRALHFPALSAALHEPQFAKMYQKINEKNPKIKMIALVAIQRKLLVLIYTLYKKNEAYDPNFEEKKQNIIQKGRQEQCPAYAA